MNVENIFTTLDDIFHSAFFPVYNKESMPGSILNELQDLSNITTLRIDALESRLGELSVLSEEARTDKQRKGYDREYLAACDEVLLLRTFRIDLLTLIQAIPTATPYSVVMSLYKLIWSFEKAPFAKSHDRTFYYTNNMVMSLSGCNKRQVEVV